MPAEHSKPPKIHDEFVRRFPKLGQAWDLMREASAGPLDERTCSLLKLAIAVGALREGAVHSSARKARALGATRAEIEQIVALAASTLGMPATVAVYSWLREPGETG